MVRAYLDSKNPEAWREGQDRLGGITPLLVLKLVTKVATEAAAGTVPHLAMANVGENAKSNAVGMAMAKEGVGLKRTCFLESGS
jgi:hypothetical protein